MCSVQMFNKTLSEQRRRPVCLRLDNTSETEIIQKTIVELSIYQYNETFAKNVKNFSLTSAISFFPARFSPGLLTFLRDAPSTNKLVSFYQ